METARAKGRLSGNSFVTHRAARVYVAMKLRKRGYPLTAVARCYGVEHTNIMRMLRTHTEAGATTMLTRHMDAARKAKAEAALERCIKGLGAITKVLPPTELDTDKAFFEHAKAEFWKAPEEERPHLWAHAMARLFPHSAPFQAAAMPRGA